MKTATTVPKTKHAEDEIFLKLYCACLSGVSSQLEHIHFLEAGLPAQDLFAKNLDQREALSVKRAFRMASLAFEELQTEQFNEKL